ncbi:MULTISPECIES: LuxR C-terminal-related transcriptional regulator [Ciceribacter]|uniref:LuxR family quorum-sensing system transcriptional regulator SinR n=1 Tax=Ciceribacter lividus TaxID=1197950 RepID=A0A6I7HU70_9HYPH|nr:MULTISPECIES: LuxR C-terminal-related transcriptional regulator [Ciceribacter]MCO6178594.1 LuxR family transcriptional regulator [Ciceribacter sp. RN22]RCW28512.1 LuxR family quorum-sensing system transcriptional regulator SinR [Ciceribacter lividus]
MINQKGYFDLLDWLESEEVVRPQPFFKRMQAEFGISNILYIDAIPAATGVRLHRIHHTYAPHVVRAVTALGPHVLTPLLKHALTSVRPLDWSMLPETIPSAQLLLSVARELSLSTTGVCYPLASREGHAALFAINVADARDWRQFRRHCDRDVHALAAKFHAAVLETADEGRHRESMRSILTGREKEALTWAAAGKSYWEIAVILGISERTVRYFMSNARRKLNVVSNTQAVAEAVWQGLISGPDNRSE